jgi:hypothetical protein
MLHSRARWTSALEGAAESFDMTRSEPANAPYLSRWQSLAFARSAMVSALLPDNGS